MGIGKQEYTMIGIIRVRSRRGFLDVNNKYHMSNFMFFYSTENRGLLFKTSLNSSGVELSK